MKDTEVFNKNLDRTYQAYFQAEGLFPLWEAAFALIVGQIFVAYFDPDICKYQQNLLTSIGLTISFIWFILVSLNLQNALHIEGKIKKLQNQFNKNYPLDLKLIYPWSNEKDKWTWSCIFWGIQQITDLREPISEKKFTWLVKISKSTWFYRRMLPLITGLVWIFLYNPYAPLLIILPIIILFFLKFDPKIEKEDVDQMNISKKKESYENSPPM